MDKIILIEDLSITEDNLEERVFQMSAGGQRELDTDDIRSIPYQLRPRMLKLMDTFRENPGIRLKREETKKSKSISLEDNKPGERWNDLSKKERELILRDSVKAEEKQDIEKEKRSEKFLSKEVETLVSLKTKDWEDLPKEGRVLILKKFNHLEQEINKIPEVEGFEELSKEKQEAILRSL